MNRSGPKEGVSAYDGPLSSTRVEATSSAFGVMLCLQPVPRRYSDHRGVGEGRGRPNDDFVETSPAGYRTKRLSVARAATGVTLKSVLDKAGVEPGSVQVARDVSGQHQGDRSRALPRARA